MSGSLHTSAVAVSTSTEPWPSRSRSQQQQQSTWAAAMSSHHSQTSAGSSSNHSQLLAEFPSGNNDSTMRRHSSTSSRRGEDDPNHRHSHGSRIEVDGSRIEVDGSFSFDLLTSLWWSSSPHRFPGTSLGKGSGIHRTKQHLLLPPTILVSVPIWRSYEHRCILLLLMIAGLITSLLMGVWCSVVVAVQCMDLDNRNHGPLLTQNGFFPPRPPLVTVMSEPDGNQSPGWDPAASTTQQMPWYTAVSNYVGQAFEHAAKLHGNKHTTANGDWIPVGIISWHYQLHHCHLTQAEPWVAIVNENPCCHHRLLPGKQSSPNRMLWNAIEVDECPTIAQDAELVHLSEPQQASANPNKPDTNHDESIHGKPNTEAPVQDDFFQHYLDSAHAEQAAHRRRQRQQRQQRRQRRQPPTPPKMDFEQSLRHKRQTCADGVTVGYKDWNTLHAAVHEANAYGAEKFVRWNEYFVALESYHEVKAKSKSPRAQATASSTLESLGPSPSSLASTSSPTASPSPQQSPYEGFPVTSLLMTDLPVMASFEDKSLYYEDEIIFIICPGTIIRPPWMAPPLFINAPNMILQCGDGSDPVRPVSGSSLVDHADVLLGGTDTNACQWETSVSHVSFGSNARNVWIRGFTWTKARSSSMLFYHAGADVHFEDCRWVLNPSIITGKQVAGFVADMNSTSTATFYGCQIGAVASTNFRSVSSLSIRQ